MWNLEPDQGRPIGAPIESESQARNWVIELTEETEALRRECDFAGSVKDQRKAFLRWMIKRGESLGVLHALQRTGKLGDVAFQELRGRVLKTQVPTVQVGVMPFQEESE